MHAVYANCFGAPEGDLLLTEEPGLGGTLVDRLVDPDRAQAVNKEVWKLAYTWAGPDDPTLVHGVSAADVGGAEAALTALVPAARGLLGMAAAMREHDVSQLTIALAQGGAGHHARIEGIQARAAAAASGLEGHEVAVSDERNAAIFGKYERTRDIDQLAYVSSHGLREHLVFQAANAVATAWRPRRRGSLMVLEYNPTRAFARAYAQRERRLRIVHHSLPRADLAAAIAAGDRLGIPASAPGPAVPFSFSRTLELDGVDLWPIVGGTLLAIAGRHAAYLAHAVPAYRRQMERWDTRAVVVPFDTPPEARTLVRVAQTLGIPTFVLSDGFKADDFTVEGATADVALCWSESMAAHYFARWPHRRTIVTGNPKAEGQLSHDVAPRPKPERILVGSFTFSPVDLNCRRSDPERFVEEIAAGIRAGAPGAQITLKLHPADEPGHYETSGIAVVTEGDVVDLFSEHDLYITTYSTSLIEAAAMGLPVIYYRINPQRLHPPFSGDAFLEARTASTPAELAELLRDPPRSEGVDVRAWAERYLGPASGASDRVAEAIESELRSRSASA